jgi:hypothetical protein
LSEIAVASEEADDIFQQDIFRFSEANDVDGCRPLVFIASSGSALACVGVVCEGKFLARKARRYEVSHSAVACCISVPNKVSDIATIDGCIVEKPICNPLGEHTAAVLVSFDVAEGSPAKQLAAQQAAAATREE